MKKWQSKFFGTAAALVTGAAPYIYFQGLPADPDFACLPFLSGVVVGLGIFGWLTEKELELKKIGLLSVFAGAVGSFAIAANWNTLPPERKPNTVCPTGARTPVAGEGILPDAEGFVPPCVNGQGKTWPPPDWPEINCPKGYEPTRRLFFHDYELIPTCRIISLPRPPIG